MPRGRARGRGRPTNLGRRGRRARNEVSRIANRTQEERLQDAETITLRVNQLRAQESEEQRGIRLEAMRNNSRQTRTRTSDADRLRNRQRMQELRSFSLSTFERAAFNYEPDIDYASHPKVIIGEMNQVCAHCNALKFKNETAGMCCASGKVVLPELNAPPEPLASLVSGVGADSKLFLRKIRKFNSCFQMTSFGASKIVTNNDGRNYETTFKIQGQVYHQIGSLYPMAAEAPKFLQIYFMGNGEEQVNIRCEYNHIEATQEKAIVGTLQILLEQRNQLIQLFKQASTRMTSDDYMVVIKADKTPVGEHAGRYNAPTIDEVSIVIVGEQFQQRDVRIMRRNDTVECIQDTHRSYDALQYPLIFWEGEDGYHINISQRNPSTG